jgi:hypothetical protein
MVEMVPIKKRETLSTKLMDFILKSKNADKIPSKMAKTLLHHWQQGSLTNESGLATLLEVAATLEFEKTTNFLEEKLQLADVAKAIRKVE